MGDAQQKAQSRMTDIVRRAKARVGQTVDDKWKLETLLGVGGMAAVYAATHRNSKRGAIKILHAEEAANPDIKARFLREGYAANQVGHPGAVSVLDDDEAPDGTVYLVMELLEGDALEDRYPAGTTMAPGDVLLVVDQLLDVLEAAHAKKIIHRDIKPGNLFLQRDGTLKVLDFGIARIHEMVTQERSEEGPPRSTLSALGTPGFMPPEQARGRWEQVDARSDLWAVGATMYTLLTGKWLHDEGTINEQLLSAMTKPVPKIATIVPDVPKAIATVVDRALEFEQDNRFKSAAEMREAVRSAYESMTGRPITLSPRLMASTPSPRVTPNPEAFSAPTIGAAPTPPPMEMLPRPVAQRAAIPAIVIGLLVVGAIVFFAFKRPAKDVASPVTIQQATTVAPHVDPTPAITTASSTPAPETSAATTAAATTSEGPRVRAPIGPKTQTNVDAAVAPSAEASVSVAPPPPASTAVDIFGRRK